MRGLAGVIVILVALAGCSSRTADYPVDYTEEVERICESVCGRQQMCMDPPYHEYDDCMALCNMPGGMHDDTVCGEAFRAFYGCIADTETCEEYLDTHNVNAENFACKEENLALGALLCGAQEGSD